MPDAKKFGDIIIADHKVLNEDNAGRDSEHNALIIADTFTKWFQGYAFKTKNTHDTLMGFKQFLGPQAKAEYCFTDGAAN